MMEDPILDAAMAWLEHCRQEADEFFDAGEVDIAEHWAASADELESAIKLRYDAGVQP